MSQQPPQAHKPAVAFMSAIDTTKASPDPYQNWQMELLPDRNLLVIVVPLDGGGVPTRSGHSTLIASTRGNRLIRGSSIRVGLNVYAEPDIAPLTPRPKPQSVLESEDDGVHPDHRQPPRAAPGGRPVLPDTHDFARLRGAQFAKRRRERTEPTELDD